MVTKKKILDSALRLFAKEGTEFSLNEVASEVGIQKASIYAHFANKEDLLSCVIGRELDSYYLEVNETFRDLESAFFTILNYYEKSEDRLYFWKRLLLFPPDGMEKTNEKIKDLTRQRFRIVCDIIRSDMDNGVIRRQDPEAVAMSYFSMIYGFLSSSIIHRPAHPERHCENLWQIFSNGIK